MKARSSDWTPPELRPLVTFCTPLNQLPDLCTTNDRPETDQISDTKV
jgi:hypothetical protein